MTQFKEFHAKSLDDAIREACAYFGVEREKLEIEIVSDAKTGIFGLVGAKKATIRAARRQAVERLTALDEAAPSGASAKAPAAPKKDDSATPAPEKPRRSGSAGTEGARRERSGRSRESASKPRDGSVAGKNAGASGSGPQPADSPALKTAGPVKNGSQSKSGTAPAPGKRVAASAGNRTPAGKPGGAKSRTETRSAVREQSSRRQPGGDSGKKRGEPRPSPANGQYSDQDPLPVVDSLRDDLPEFDLSSCDPELLKARVAAVVSRLVTPIVGDVPCAVSIGKDRVRASLDCGDASGLLVGREGQTLASIQYLAARIIARELGGAVRLHVDVGNYREKQDDRVKDLAIALAARAKKTRRPQMTRPLSAYQRRIVHLSLEGDTEVGTRSRGEGAQRRVMIYLKNQDQTAAVDENAEIPASFDEDLPPDLIPEAGLGEDGAVHSYDTPENRPTDKPFLNQDGAVHSYDTPEPAAVDLDSDEEQTFPEDQESGRSSSDS